MEYEFQFDNRGLGSHYRFQFDGICAGSNVPLYKLNWLKLFQCDEASRRLEELPEPRPRRELFAGAPVCPDYRLRTNHRMNGVKLYHRALGSSSAQTDGVEYELNTIDASLGSAACCMLCQGQLYQGTYLSLFKTQSGSLHSSCEAVQWHRLVGGTTSFCTFFGPGASAIYNVPTGYAEILSWVPRPGTPAAAAESSTVVVPSAASGAEASEPPAQTCQGIVVVNSLCYLMDSTNRLDGAVPNGDPWRTDGQTIYLLTAPPPPPNFPDNSACLVFERKGNSQADASQGSVLLDVKINANALCSPDVLTPSECCSPLPQQSGVQRLHARGGHRQLLLLHGQGGGEH